MSSKRLRDCKPRLGVRQITELSVSVTAFLDLAKGDTRGRGEFDRVAARDVRLAISIDPAIALRIFSARHKAIPYVKIRRRLT
jgi:hypothetical protein